MAYSDQWIGNGESGPRDFDSRDFSRHQRVKDEACQERDRTGNLGLRALKTRNSGSHIRQEVICRKTHLVPWEPQVPGYHQLNA